MKDYLQNKEETINAILKALVNKIIEDGLKNTTNANYNVSLKDYCRPVNFCCYKDKIIKLLNEDERVADVEIDKNFNIDMIFFNDYCLGFDEDEEEL